MSDQAVRAADSPYAIDVEEGKSYFWCACGKSSKQPFCDGSHKGSSFSPVKFNADSNKKVYFCGCKTTGTQPLCDGSHKN
ncbi:MAG: CDGSH iron-sulfur domain-containing protein [bacterium]